MQKGLKNNLTPLEIKQKIIQDYFTLTNFCLEHGLDFQRFSDVLYRRRKYPKGKEILINKYQVPENYWGNGK